MRAFARAAWAGSCLLLCWGAAARPSSFAHISSWGIQLTGYGSARLSNVATAPFDLVVVDPVDDSGAPWQASEVQAAARGRWVVAYLSVGAAESYRPYWQANWQVGKPSWLLRADPDWPGNYDVAYWNPAWQQLVLAQLAQLLAQGFDGMYMDMVDAYQLNPQRPSARSEMVQWICELSRYAHKRKPGFLIIAQNAAELIRDPGYAACVQASANESTFMYPNNTLTEPERQRKLLSDFSQWRKLGKPVLVLEYATNDKVSRWVYAKARARGLVPYVSVRALNVLLPGR